MREAERRGKGAGPNRPGVRAEPKLTPLMRVTIRYIVLGYSSSELAETFRVAHGTVRERIFEIAERLCPGSAVPARMRIMLWYFGADDRVLLDRDPAALPPPRALEK